MANCSSCGMELNQSWRHCPVCGPANQLSCDSCGAELQPGWRACPLCGAAIVRRESVAGKASQAMPSSDYPEIEPWSLYLRLKHEYEAPLVEFGETARRQEEKITSFLAATDPVQCERAATAAFRAVVSALQSDPYLTRHPALNDAASRLNCEQGQLLGQLGSALSGLQSRLEEVRKLGVTDSDVTSFLKAFGEAASADSKTGMAATAGGIIGNFLLPGVGAVVGGSVGAYLVGSQTDKQQQTALANYVEAASHVIDCASRLFAVVWDHCLAGLPVAPGNKPLPPCAHFVRATEQWASLAAQLTDVGSCREIQSGLGKIEVFLNQWGHSPDALHYMIRLSLPPRTSDTSIASHHADLLFNLFRWLPVAYEDTADVALENRDFAGACRRCEDGRAKFPNEPGLWLSQIEALAASGEVSASYASEMLARKTEVGRQATFHCIRGLIRGDRNIEAAVLMGRWIGEDGRPAAVARRIRSDATTNRLIAEHQLVVPGGIDGELAGIIEARLKFDQTRVFGEPAADILRNATKEYLPLREGEQILYFRDWSVWKNGKTGFAITSQRVLWKCLWEAAVSIELREIQTLLNTDNYLTVNGNRVDVEDKEEAASLVETLRELNELLCA